MTIGILIPLVALVVGLFLGWLASVPRIRAAANQAQAEAKTNEAVLQEQLTRLPQIEKELSEAKKQSSSLSNQLADLRQEKGAAESTVKARDKQVEQLEGAVEALEQKRIQQEEALGELKAQKATAEAELEAERKQSQEKLALLEQAREQLTLQFKELANQILEDKSKRFTEQNQVNIKQILDPLNIKLAEFKDQVEKSYTQENKDRAALAEQVKQLMDLNAQISDDAKNLTSALKGQSKTRGDWGELMLERILENAGLRKDHEYTTQESHTREDGTRAQPDVVIHLPGDKHLVVDSKISLTAYLEYAEAEDDRTRDTSLKRHLASIKNHIKGLSGKNYQTLYGLNSLDCVVMFVPIEPAFMLAISSDPVLWQDAWNKNVLLVSPTTLLFVVRTVAHIWRQEHQNLNAQAIAERGGALYDKFVSFVNDLETIGNRLRMARESYDHACTKLHVGRGNLVRQAEMLKELGVSSKKSLPQDMTEMALNSVKESPPSECADQ